MVISRRAIFAGALALTTTFAKADPVEVRDCEYEIGQTATRVDVMRSALDSVPTARNSAACHLVRLYFLELVKERALIMLCENGAEREPELGRLDGNIEQANRTIASNCPD
jgi:hypothetical protein